MQIRLQETKVRKQIQITTFATFFLPDFETFGGGLGRSTVAHFARKVRGANIVADKHRKSNKVMPQSVGHVRYVFVALTLRAK